MQTKTTRTSTITNNDEAEEPAPTINTITNQFETKQGILSGGERGQCEANRHKFIKSLQTIT